MSKWTQLKESSTAYWYINNEAGEILSVPKNEDSEAEEEFYRHDLDSPQGL